MYVYVCIYVYMYICIYVYIESASHLGAPQQEHATALKVVTKSHSNRVTS